MVVHADSTRSGGAILPFVVHTFTLDPFISATNWLLHAVSAIPQFATSSAIFSSSPGYYSQSRSWSTFLHPPEPSPAAIMLPTPPRLQHIRPTTERSSFFAQRTTLPPTAYGLDRNTMIPPLPGSELDEETQRWLAAYPNDPELVPLIATLRAGQENDDFILSAVGLVYLRPEGDESALLVPPSGEIRRELLEDAHAPLPKNGEVTDKDEAIHKSVQGMLAELSETFWWMALEEDAMDFVKTCEECARRKIELKPGMTALAFTGVTGWTEEVGDKTGIDAVGESAMAAEMAFAMRKAEAEAEVAL